MSLSDRSPFRQLLALLPWGKRRPFVPVVRLTGTIGLSSPLRPGLSIVTAAPLLERAFGMSGASAVAVVINSPGGSPVQSHLIYQRIRALAAEEKRKVYVFIEDVGASGGYLIALAGDEIIADAASIVGSIGVVTATFGFDKLIAHYGIDRRVYTAGESKASLDPFLPEREEDVRRLKTLQQDVHGLFIGLVRDRRRGRIGAESDGLFTGEFWSGTRALELGLIDRIGDVRSVMRETFGPEVNLVSIAQPRGLFGRRALGFDIASVIGTLRAEALWTRFGL